MPPSPRPGRLGGQRAPPGGFRAKGMPALADHTARSPCPALSARVTEARAEGEVSEVSEVSAARRDELRAHGQRSVKARNRTSTDRGAGCGERGNGPGAGRGFLELQTGPPRRDGGCSGGLRGNLDYEGAAMREGDAAAVSEQNAAAGLLLPVDERAVSAKVLELELREKEGDEGRWRRHMLGKRRYLGRDVGALPQRPVQATMSRADLARYGISTNLSA